MQLPLSGITASDESIFQLLLDLLTLADAVETDMLAEWSGGLENDEPWGTFKTTAAADQYNSVPGSIIDSQDEFFTSFACNGIDLLGPAGVPFDATCDHSLNPSFSKVETPHYIDTGGHFFVN
jgi:hypothetical protein